MRARLVLLILAMSLEALPAGAAEWGLIRPGVSTTETVRERYGAPTRVARQKVDTYDTESWVYEGDRAPAGIQRMTVNFGLLVDTTYRPAVVRSFQLEPHGSTFNRGIIGNGWGLPDGGGHQGEEEFFVYKDGLLVYFDKEGWNVRLMIFTLPQPRDPTEGRR